MVTASVCSKQLDFVKIPNAHPLEEFYLSLLLVSIRLSIRSYVCKKAGWRFFLSIPDIRINLQGIFSTSSLMTVHVKVSWESLWPKTSLKYVQD